MRRNQAGITETDREQVESAPLISYQQELYNAWQRKTASLRCESLCPCQKNYDEYDAREQKQSDLRENWEYPQGQKNTARMLRIQRRGACNTDASQQTQKSVWPCKQ